MYNNISLGENIKMLKSVCWIKINKKQTTQYYSNTTCLAGTPLHIKIQREGIIITNPFDQTKSKEEKSNY